MSVLTHLEIQKKKKSDEKQMYKRSRRSSLDTFVKDVVFIIAVLAVTSRFPSSFGAQDAVFLLQSSDATTIG